MIEFLYVQFSGERPLAGRTENHHHACHESRELGKTATEQATLQAKAIGNKAIMKARSVATSFIRNADEYAMTMNIYMEARSDIRTRTG